jgi:hypothetical protein
VSHMYDAVEHDLAAAPDAPPFATVKALVRRRRRRRMGATVTFAAVVLITTVVVAASLGRKTSEPAVSVSPTGTLATSPTTNPTAPSSLAPASSKVAAPSPPRNKSTLETTLETLGIPTHLLLDEVGVGSGESREFSPTVSAAISPTGPANTGTARILVEWRCAPGGSMKANVSDGSGDISGSLENGFDGSIPPTTHPLRVIWNARGACSWHVRALDQQRIP